MAFGAGLAVILRDASLRDAPQDDGALVVARLMPLSLSLPLVTDRAEVFVDAKHDQDEFGDDARKDHAYDHAGDGGQQHDEAAERADRHHGETGKNAGDAEQHDQCDHQPIKGLDDRGRDKTVPLKQILKIKHRSFSRQVEYDSRLIRLLMAQGLAPNAVLSKSSKGPAR